MYPYFSIMTVILYYIVGLFCLICVDKIIKTNAIQSKKRICFILWITLTFFAALRLVNEYGIGGCDAAGYEDMLLNNAQDQMDRMEPLFAFYTKLISIIWQSPIFYRFVSYGIIAFGYCYFIYIFCRDKIMSPIPFIFMVFPYLRSFNTMRTSMAIAVFLIGLIWLYENKYLKSFIAIICAAFIHRMSVLYVLFIPFYFIFRHKDFSTNQKIFIFLIFYAVIGYFLALYIQAYVLSLSSFSEHDAYYLSYSLGTSLLDRIPLMIQHILMLVALTLWNNKLPNNQSIHFLRLLVIFDIIVIPASVVLGMWRSVEYMYIPRLTMWSYLIPAIIYPYVKDNGFVLKCCFFTIFSIWLIFRINREWEPCGLSPYLLFFQS